MSRLLIMGTLVAACATVLIAAAAQDQGTAPKQRNVDKEADELLRAMCEVLAGATSLSFRAAIIEDIPDDESGKLIHFLTQRTIAIQRPGRLRVDEVDRFARHQAWFAASRFTLYDSAANQFATVSTPLAIDGMLQQLFDEHGLVMPIADLIVSDPHSALSAGIETGDYLGEAVVSGRLCHHLAFRQENLDWQIWVDAQAERPVPLKLVITYKNEVDDPQFAATFSEWDLEAVLPRGHFEAALPGEAKQVSLEELIKVGRDKGETEGGAS